MTLSAMNLDPLFLAARVAHAYNKTHKMAYAHLSTELNFLQVSPNFISLLQTSNTELLGQPMNQVLWEFVGAESDIEAVLTGKRPSYRLEYVNRELTDGSFTYLTFHITPLHEHDPSDGLLLLVEDVTEYGRLQQQTVQDRNEVLLVQSRLAQANQELKHLNQQKSLFLSMAAHDLQTPLSAIYMFTDMLLGKKEVAATSQQEYMEIIRAQSSRLGRLVANLLDLDRVERGNITIQPTECVLNVLIEEVVDVLKIEAQKRDIRLNLSLPSPAIVLWADSAQILQILYNLIGNALKYTLTNGTIKIEAEETETAVIFKISDSGLGMSEDQKENLFKLYYRTKSAKESMTRGHGLGLFIVKSLVEAHNGHITVDTIPEKGTTFTIRFPLFNQARDRYIQELDKRAEVNE